MGFYDCRCMVTGVSLKGVDTVLIPLQQSANAYIPITLALKGNYNRLGAIDGVQKDANASLILKYFCDRLQDDEFVIHREYLQGFGYYPFRTIENLLSAFERNINDDPEAAVLRGKPVVFALICQVVWDAIARALPVSESTSGIYRLLFNDSPIAHGIYSESHASVSEHLRELCAVDSYVSRRGLIWHPDEEPGQHYAEEMLEFLGDAREAFCDSTVVLEALDAYEEEVADL